MPRNVTATLEVKTTAESSARPAAVGGMAPVAKMPTALSSEAMTYQRLRDNVVSAIGAQANFQVWGRRPSAIRAAVRSTGTPDLVSMKPTATVTNPEIAPKGTIRIMNTQG